MPEQEDHAHDMWDLTRIAVATREELEAELVSLQIDYDNAMDEMKRLRSQLAYMDDLAAAEKER